VLLLIGFSFFLVGNNLTLTTYSVNSKTFACIYDAQLSTGATNYVSCNDAMEGLDSPPDTQNLIIVGQWIPPVEGWFDIGRGYFAFNTQELAALPLSAITKVTFTMPVASIGIGNTFDVIVQKPISSTFFHIPRILSDFSRAKYEGEYGRNAFPPKDQFDLNPAILVLDGITKIVLRTDRDINYQPPTPEKNSEYVTIKSMESDEKPSLYIEWVVPSYTSLYTKSSLNPILRPGSSGWDSRDVAHPTVIYHNDQFMMWYCGRGGSYWDIGLATSSDGSVWNKYGGNPVLVRGASGQPDSYSAYTPEVIFHEGKFKMWYGGLDGSKVTTCYAESTDGMTWTKYGRVLNVGASGAWDSAHAYAPTVWVFNETYYLMYYGVGSDGKGRIGLATSSDGLSWSKNPSNPIFNLVAGTWESFDLGAHDVEFYNGQWIMWYGASDDIGIKRIGYAESSDLVSWTKYEENPILDVGSAGSWDEEWVTAPYVYLSSSIVYLFYEGRNAVDNYQIGLATAKLESTIPLTSTRTLQYTGACFIIVGIVLAAYDYGRKGKVVSK